MRKKKRVLIDSFHLIQALTGIRTYTTQLCEGIESRNFDELEYLIYPNWRRLNQTEFLRGKVNAPKKLLNHMLFFIWKQVCLPVLILVKRIDLIITTDYLLPYLKFGAKSITVFHDTFYWELKGSYNPLWRKYFVKSVEAGLNRSTIAVVTTKYIAEKVRKNVTAKHDISIVYQPPKTLKYDDSKSSELLKFGVPMNTKYFLHVGIFEKRKNLRVLVEAFAKLIQEEIYSDFHLVLAGSRAVGWFHDDFDQISDLVAERKLTNRVIIPGFIPNELLGALYKEAFAYIFPSREEGFGIPIIEAMNSKLPLIISNQPALMEVAQHAALVFDMNSVEELSARMVEIMEDEVRLRLIKAGEERAELFSQGAFVQQFHDLAVKCVHS